MLSIIIPWRDRPQLASTIVKFYEAADELQGEIVIVNFGGDYTLLDSLIPQQNRQHIKIINLTGIPYFNLSATRNIGIHYASHDLLFLCDCDILVDSTVIKDNVQLLNNHDNVFINPEGVFETDGEWYRKTGTITHIRMGLGLTFDNGRSVETFNQAINRENGTRAGKGLMFIHKSMLLAINGYNSVFEGWGWEDTDLVIRLQATLGAKPMLQGFFTHLSHGDAERVQHYEIQDRHKSNRAAYEIGLARYDKGNFLGTYQEDIKRFSECEVIQYC